MKTFLLGILLLLVSGCGGEADDGKIHLRLRFWGGADGVRITNKLVRDFEKLNPDIKVKSEPKPANPARYAESLMTELAAGREPDVIFVSSTISDILEEAKVMEDMRTYIKKDADLSLDDFYPQVLDQFTFDSGLIAVPRDIAPIACVYYNKALFDKAGVPYPSDEWNWDDLLSAAKKMNHRTGKSMTSVFGYTEDWAMLEPWVFSSGGAFVDDFAHPKKIVLDTPEAIRGIRYRYELMAKHKVMPATGENQGMAGGAEALFLNGQAAMFLSGIWKSPSLRDIKDFDWDIVMFPKGPEGKRGFASGGSGSTLR